MVLDPSMGPPGSFGHVRLLLGPTFAQPATAAGSIHIGSNTLPSGSWKVRLYMKPMSCAGLGSEPPA